MTAIDHPRDPRSIDQQGAVMETVTKPEYGSVEHYAEMFRRNAKGDGLVVARLVSALVEDVATAEDVLAVGEPVRTASDAERLERIRNICAAGHQVRAELRR
jgi:hypothetical protein